MSDHWDILKKHLTEQELKNYERVLGWIDQRPSKEQALELLTTIDRLSTRVGKLEDLLSPMATALAEARILGDSLVSIARKFRLDATVPQEVMAKIDAALAGAHSELPFKKQEGVPS